MLGKARRIAGRASSVFASVALTIVVVAATAAAATAGDPFRLGVTNVINGALTRLTGSFTGAMLQVDNPNTGTGARAAKIIGRSPQSGALLARNTGGGPAADFVVTPGVVPFTVSSDAKVTNLNADRIDGLDSTAFAPAVHDHDARYQARLGRTVVVGPVGTPSQNGQALVAALGAITGASSSNPYLLKIEPGIYDIGTGSLVMTPFVDVEGSGRDITIIRGSDGGGCCWGTVNGASNAGLRSVTVENTGGSFEAFAIFTSGVTDFRVRDVTARSLSTTTASGGYAMAIALLSSTRTTIEDSEARATGGPDRAAAIYVQGGSATIVDSTARASDAAWNQALSVSDADATVRDSVLIANDTSGGRTSFGIDAGGSSATTAFGVTVDGSRIIGATNRIRSGGSEYYIRVGATMLAGGPAATSNGAISCAASWTEVIAGVAAVNATCN